VDNTNKGAGTAPRNGTGRECLIVCLWGYATYLTVHSTLAHLDRGGIHPTTVVTTLASISTRGVVRHVDYLPEATPVLHHQCRHSQASVILGPKAPLSDGRIITAAQKTRPHPVIITGKTIDRGCIDKGCRSYPCYSHKSTN
jgi:hypothetical protein